MESDNKRIAKNTVFLYVRMLFTLFVGLFTSRIVLNALGVSDYGLNSVIAGVLSMLTYVNSLLSQGTARFLTIGLGKGNFNKLRNLFKACISLHYIIAVFVFIIGETVGLWFVNTQLNIDEGRYVAANVVFQFALFNSVLSLIQAPFQASIISHEKMGVFAYMSIYDVVMKLLVAFFLLYVETDKLILYSILYFCINLTSIIIYNTYCRKHFKECGFAFGLNKEITKEIGGFIGWNAIESFSWMLNAQGLNVLLNIFFSTVVNAARGIVTFISGAISLFISNFQTAARPQIFKHYAQGEIEQMNQLIKNNSKYSSYILLIMSIPVVLETRFIYHIWLGQNPDYTIPFLRLTLIQMLFISMDSPIIDGLKAVGKLKKVGVLSALIYLSFLAFWYMMLKLGISPVVVYALYVIQTPIIAIVNLLVLSQYTGMNPIRYFFAVPMKTICIGLLSFVLPYLIYNSMEEGWGRFMIVSVVSVTLSSVFVFIFGIDLNQRKSIIQFIKSKFLWK